MKILSKSINGALFFAMGMTFFFLSMNFFQRNGLLEQWYGLIFSVTIVGAIILAAVTYVVLTKIEPFICWLVVVVSKLYRWPWFMWKNTVDRVLLVGVMSIAVIPFLHTVAVLKYHDFTMVNAVFLNIIFSVLWYLGVGGAVNILEINTEGVGFLKFPKLSNFLEGEND